MKILINNGSSTTYTGAAHRCLPLEPVHMTAAIQQEIKKDADDMCADYDLVLTDKAGVAIQAQGKLLATDGTSMNLFVTVPGTWAPGATELDLVSIGLNRNAPQRPAAMHGSQALNTWIAIQTHFDGEDPAWMVYRFNNPALLAYQTATDGNAGFWKSKFSLPLQPTLLIDARLDLTFTSFAQEKGTRLRIGVRNSGRNRWMKGATDPDIRIDKCMLISVDQQAANAIEALATQYGVSSELLIQNHLPELNNPDYTSSLATSHESDLGEAVGSKIILVDGKRKGTVKMGGLNTALESAEIWCSSGAIAHGNTQGGSWAPRHWPGKALDPNHDAESAKYVSVEAGRSLMFEVFLGEGVTHEQLLRPTTVAWKDLSHYDRMHITTLPNHEAAQHPKSERLAKDIIQGHTHGDNTIFDQRRKGWFYQLPPEENPCAGYRDHGGHYWSSGFTSSAHYDMLGSYFAYGTCSPADQCGAWNEIAYQGALHFMQQGMYYSLPVTGKSAVGCTYEKGASSAGIYGGPTVSHSWMQGVVMQAIHNYDFDAMSLVVGWLNNVQVNDMMGGISFTQSAADDGFDSRDWQWATNYNRYSTVSRSRLNRHRPWTAGNGGWQGDWGVRLIGWPLEQMCHIRRAMLLPVDDVVDNYVRQIERMEAIWKGRGYILNRALRHKGYEDGTKPWMHHIITRGLMWARDTIELTPEQEAMTERFMARAVDYIELDQDVYFPGGMITVAGELTDDHSLTRVGMLPVTASLMLDALDSSLDDATRVTAWEEFKNRWDTEAEKGTADLSSGVVPADDEWWYHDRLVSMGVLIAQADDEFPDKGVTAFDNVAGQMRALQHDCMELRTVKGGLNMARLADLMAFRRLKGWNTPAENAVFDKLIDTTVFYHQLNRGATKRVSPLGYKMAAQYPGTETKAWGAILDTRALQSVLINEDK